MKLEKPERWATLKSHFEELLDLDDPERQGRLAVLAGTDPELCEQLARLLAADASAERRLQPYESPLTPPATVLAAHVPAAAAPAAYVSSAPEREALSDPFGLLGRTVSHFAVQEVLGGGGMGVVYRAEDLRLGRTVALKFLLPQYSLDTAAKERFLLEARATAALDHPYICTIHEAGESEQGQLFLAMSCYAGETLKERLAREGVLSIEEALELARQLSRGLGAAHAAGVVHRDLKPGNLMLSAEGGLKILDFGLAKVREVSLTGSGLRPGTAAYMSPEQLQGEAVVDERSDLWSLGVVLYEMLTGKLPFGAGHELSTVYRIVFEEPPAPSVLREEIPAELEAILLRLLSKEPEARYASAAEALQALEAVDKPEADSISPARPRAGLMHRHSRTRQWEMLLGSLGLGGLMVLLAAFWLLQRDSPPLHPKRVVVAPFENRTGDPALDPIGSMVADWITHGLSHMAVIDVVPVSTVLVSARHLRESVGNLQPLDPIRALAEETAAGLVVSGAYYQVGDSLRFQAQITDARQRRLLRALEPATGVQDDPTIAIELLRQRSLAALAPLLDIRLAPHAPLTRPPPSYEAFTAYADGMESLARGELRGAIEHFGRALVIDSTYLLARLEIAHAHSYLGELAQADSVAREVNRSREQLGPYERARLDLRIASLQGDRMVRYEAAKRATAIAPGSHMHLEWAVEALRLHRPREAIRILSQVDPTRAAARKWPNYWYLSTQAFHLLGEHRRELRTARRARALNPDDPTYLWLEARALVSLGRLSELEAVINARWSLPEHKGFIPGVMMMNLGSELREHGYPDAASEMLRRAIAWYNERPEERRDRYARNYGSVLMRAEQWQEAEAVFRALVAEDPENIGYQGPLGVIAARRGEFAEVERIDAWLAGREDPYLFGTHTFYRAIIAAHAGRKEEAVARLREALSQDFRSLPFLHASFLLHPLRDHPPFQELIRPSG